MACCLMTPSHYLNQCWLIISHPTDIDWRAVSRKIPQPSITKICLKITYLKFQSNLPGSNELKVVYGYFRPWRCLRTVFCVICNTCIKRDHTGSWVSVHPLTHWGWVMYICVSKLIIIDSDNGLSSGRRQAIIWTNAGILLIRTIGTNFSVIISEIHTFSFKKMHLKMSSAK